MSPVSLLLSDKAKKRFDAFSDGVFAIVITLLVLELHVPAGRQHLASTLGEEWPRYLGYFVSFAFIGGVWVAHSTVSHFIKAVDATLMRLNLVLLLSCRCCRSRRASWPRTSSPRSCPSTTSPSRSRDSVPNASPSCSSAST